MSEDGITEARLRALVEAFYAKVRQDPTLAPIFGAAVEDWPEHLDRLQAFWSSVMLTSGRYKGNPLAAHTPLNFDESAFDVWLGLWRETTAELFAPAEAAALNARAERIAESLKLALFFRLPPKG
jgi:hemoglobin